MGGKGGLIERDTEKKARVISLEVLLVFALAVVGFVGIAFLGMNLTEDVGEEAHSLEQQLDKFANQ